MTVTRRFGLKGLSHFTLTVNVLHCHANGSHINDGLRMGIWHTYCAFLHMYVCWSLVDSVQLTEFITQFCVKKFVKGGARLKFQEIRGAILAT